MPDHIAHRDGCGRFCQPVAAMLARYAFDPPLRFQLHEDLLQEFLGNIIRLRKSPRRNELLIPALNQGKESS
jgi:hypothetical protein